MVRAYFVSTRFSIQIEKADDFSYIWKKGTALYRGTLNLVNFANDGLLDFKNSSTLLFSSKLEEHHIFPKAYLRKIDHEYDDSLIDCVANKALVPKVTNIKIGEKAPSVYLAELQQSNPKLIDALKSHSIPAELVDGSLDLSFEQFVATRSSDLLKMLTDLLGPLREAVEHDLS